MSEVIQKSADWQDWPKKYPTMDLQAEFFLLKFGKDDDIVRPEVLSLKDQFKKFAKPNKGELEEDEALRLLESRDQTKTFKEMRQMVADIDIDKNRKLSFLEWACAIYSKSWDKLHALTVDPQEVAKLEALAKAAAEEEKAKRDEVERALIAENERRVEQLRAEQKKAEKENNVEATKAAKLALEAELARQAEELKAKHAAEVAEKARIEKESAEKRSAELKRQGVAGKVALFKYAASDTQDITKKNAARIHNEVAKKKEIKKQEIEALAMKKLAEEDVAKKMAEKAEAEQHAFEAAQKAKEAEQVKK